MAILSNRAPEFAHLFAQAVTGYLATPTGQQHLGFYTLQRDEAERNLERILAKRGRGEDVTDDVLMGLLPYTDTAPNRKAGAWVHIAPAITGDLRKWYERARRTNKEDWPRIAEAILTFVLRCREHPEELGQACEEFSALPYSKGFQTGMLSPILNALNPDAYRIVNNKVRTVINYLAGTNHGQPLTEYPDTNATTQSVVRDVADTMRSHPLPEGVRLDDAFDLFCHWLVSVRKYGFAKRFTVLTESQVEGMLDRVRQAFPDWLGLEDPRFVCHEVEYKRRAVEKAQGLLAAADLRRLLEEGQHEEILTRLESVGRSTNLMYIATPRTGDLGILYQERLDKPSFCQAIYTLLHGDGPSEERLVAYTEYVRAHDLPNKWSFPTYLLFLCHPDTEMFVKPYTIRWLFDFAGKAEQWDWKPDGSMYATLKAMARDLLVALEPYGAIDMVDVQSVIWACYGYKEGVVEPDEPGGPPRPDVVYRTGELAKPFSRIFADWEEAEWAFALLRDALHHLGVSDPDDERFLVSVRQGREGGQRLRLLYGNWPVLGFQGPQTLKHRVELALLERLATDLEGYRAYTFSQPEGQQKVNLYALPMDTARAMEGRLRPALQETLNAVAGLFGHWKRLGVRSPNQPGIVRAILHPEELPGVLSGGVADAARPAGYFSEETFTLLEDLAQNPTRAFYQERRETFSEGLEQPFAALLADVARRLPAQVTQVLETERNVTAHIAKNDYGRGGAWDYYWGAFYPKGGKRTTDAQLFVWMNSAELRYGFYLGDYGVEAQGRFWRNVQTHRERLAAILSEVLGDLAGATFGPEDQPNESLGAWLKASTPYPRAGVALAAEEVLALSREDLAECIAAAFQPLFSLVLLAISDDPIPAIEAYVGETPTPDIQPLYSLEQCSAETGFAVEDLREWLAALDRKGQAILYGPPGTGKTYLARRLAQHLVGGTDGFIDVVQFHPAYAYEDFVQGIRPQPDTEGRLTYPVVRGRFLRFCDEAARRQGPCVLIVDEINRAELSRVFGELMYLLEYRGEQVRLAVDGHPFAIPANVRLIGTMNTADRSIALVDHALRRRFAFIALYPQYSVLRRYHAERTGLNVEGLIATLQRVNEAVDDPNYALGISYFLDDKLAQHLPGIWRMEVLPYLEEYFFDQPDRVKPYRWENVRGSIALEQR